MLRMMTMMPTDAWNRHWGCGLWDRSMMSRCRSCGSGYMSPMSRCRGCSSGYMSMMSRCRGHDTGYLNRSWGAGSCCMSRTGLVVVGVVPCCRWRYRRRYPMQVLYLLS
jgi:hypothetical protein